jgi:ATP adenylyltransferase
MSYFFNFDKMNYVRGPRPDGCILCLVREKSPEVVDLTVFGDDLVTVSVNLYPYNPGHIMIFPNRHLVDGRELTVAEETRVSELSRAFLDVLDVIPRYPREIGIADLVAGKRVLIEDPRTTQRRVTEEAERQGLSCPPGRDQ